MSDEPVPPPLLRGKPAPRRWFIAMMLAGLAFFMALWVTSSWFDFPALADRCPDPIAKALEGSKARCYVYHVVGGFFELDQTDLWMIDGDAGEIAAVVKALDVREVPAAPAPFWRMRPYYWPRSFTPGIRCYRSTGFNEDGSATGHPDQSCVVTDEPNHRAYVWHVEIF